jgi:hypothetical protein
MKRFGKPRNNREDPGLSEREVSESIHRGSGLLTLGEKEFPVDDGAVALIPKGTWHGLKNTGTDNVEMRFGYMPAGFEGFFREVGTSIGQPFVAKAKEQRKAVAAKWGMTYKSL